MTTVWIAGDQLSPRNSALEGLERKETVVLLIESLARGRERPYHKRRLALIYAAMRGFADDLRGAGWQVDYHAEREDYAGPLAEHVAAIRPSRVRMMTLADYGVTEGLAALVREHGLELDVTPQVNFISTAGEFEELFARGQTRVTMETFYRRMRRKTGLLMEGDEPLGGAWNFDHDNRLPPKRGMRFPAQPDVPLREHARAAIALVERHIPNHPGNIGTFDIPTSTPSHTRTISSRTASIDSDRTRMRWWRVKHVSIIPVCPRSLISGSCIRSSYANARNSLIARVRHGSRPSKALSGN